MCDPYYRCHVLGSATGTSVKHTAPKRIVSYPYSMPKRTLVDRFEESVAPNFEQLSTLLRTNQKLRAARDLLLPRLMSGEIEVSN
jgi:type I restriction enzyme S subunit